jgi:hypothetical protein
VAFSPTTKPEKSIAEKATTVRVCQKLSKPVETGLFTQTKPMCELVEGIVTVAHHCYPETSQARLRYPRDAVPPS